MAPPGTGDRSHAVQVSVDLDSPSFVPGSRLSAVITVRCEIASPVTTDRLRFTVPPNRAPLPTVVPNNKSSPASAAALRGLGADEYALVDYVVCEVSGRWTTDRAWVVPEAHAPASSTTLDLHSQPPLAAQVTSGTAPPVDSNSLSRPWNAALDDANKVGGGGRLGHSGVIFRSPTLVACEREQVPVGSQTSFAVQCVLPDEIPPTLRGTAVRYSYALVVVMQLPDSSAPKSVRVPFRVVCARPGTSASDAPIPIRVPTPISSGPIPNLFLERVRSRPLMMAARLLKSAPPDDIEVALALSLNGRLTPYAANGEPWRATHALDEDALSFVREAAPDMPSVGDDMEISSPSSLRRPFSKRNAVPVYSITRGKDSIARMYLPKRRLLLGDNLSAVFYFQADKPCLQLGARLEMQEIVKAKYSLGTKQDGTSAKGTVFRKVYGEHGEFVSMNRNTHVTFSIPYDAPASFCTDVVEVRWLLHFVFLIPQEKRSRLAQHTASAGSTVLDDHEATRLLDQVEIEADSGSDEDELPGWSGGTWAGENPATFKAIPRGEVDVLRWTLPLQVMGEAYSQWGNRSHGRIRLETRGK